MTLYTVKITDISHDTSAINFVPKICFKTKITVYTKCTKLDLQLNKVQPFKDVLILHYEFIYNNIQLIEVILVL